MNEAKISLEQALRGSFNQRAAELDAATLSRLNQARQRALDELRPPRWSDGLAGLNWQPLAAVSMLVLVAVLLVPLQSIESASPLFLPSEASILALDEGFDYIDELEFGLWLDQAVPLAAIPE